MDRLEEIWQRTEAGGPIRRIDMKHLLSEVDRLNALHKREIIITGEYAQRVIDLTARAEKAEKERDELKALCRPVCPVCGLKNDRHFQGILCDRCGANLRGPQEEK